MRVFTRQNQISLCSLQHSDFLPVIRYVIDSTHILQPSDKAGDGGGMIIDSTVAHMKLKL